ncbi:MAG TPA: cysteine desulfurase family protein [Spirochaetales bacterium]|nr:cysteine desulfurase family protein [Spirochaetales bacterium]HRY53373.1 cysteine desulfurase family protein [Spirochaetia bacterium]HRZ65235.1 cysteine desulfurase family protein [Spirochaetia bacterium]
MAAIVYLDNAATTPVDPAVLERMLPYFSGKFGNPMTAGRSSLGDEARAAVELARREVAALIGARPEQLAFTSGGAESDNWAIKGASERAALERGLERPHIVATAFEHAAVLESVEAMRRRGFEASLVRVGRDGIVDPGELRRALRPETVLVSIMHANNEVGTIQPVAEAARAARERGALLHVDAVQSAGHVPIDVDELGADFLSISAHKFGGPKGAGALYARDWRGIFPLVDGGGQEWGLRGSTHNVPGIVGLGAAAALARERLPAEALRLAALRDRLHEGLAARCGRVKANGDMRRRLPQNLNLRIEGIDNEALLMAMSEAGVVAAGCSACSGGPAPLSRALLAMGLSAAEARSSLRLSLGAATGEEDIERAVELISGIVRILRSRGAR